MGEKILNAKEYAAKRKVSIQATCELLRKYKGPNNSLPGVVSVAKLGRTYMLTVDPKKIRRGRAKCYSKK